MFSKATANFVHQIDPEGSLIHVSRVNDSHKLVPMALVVKRKGFWNWQKPKYQPTDFILSDLLLGDKVLSPGVCETEFLTYEGTFGGKLSGKLKTEAASVSIALEGKGTSKLQSCFGMLKKEELDVKKLLCDSSDRLVNMQHVLVQQLKKHAEVLTIVKERILTTNSCSVTQTKKESCTFQGVLRMIDMLGSSLKVCVKDSNNIEMDSDVSLVIPSGTVVAYSILELEIKRNGQYDICLQPGTIGGFEADSSVTSSSSHDFLDMVDGARNMDLSPLAELPQSTQCVLCEKLRQTMRDRSALSYLQCVLEDLCSGESASPAHIKAAHLLVSAMEELPDETLMYLSESCPVFLEALNTLMCRINKSSQPLPIQCLPSFLQDDQAFQVAEQLLSSINMTLSRDTNRLWMETGNKAGFLPLLLHLSIQGLSLLCNRL